MSALISIVEGWNGALPFTLLADGDPIDLTGLYVHVYIKNQSGTMVKATSSGIEVTNATGGEVEYTPSSSSGDLFLAAETPYKVRFKVSDALGKFVFFPNDEEELIEVNPV